MVTTRRRGTGPRPPLVAAVDAGTTGARAMAYDLAGRLVAEVRRPYRTSSPRPGWAEQDARDWAECAAAALRGLAGRTRAAGQIRAIGLTGQCPTMVVADSRGQPLRAGMMYRDNRAVAEARQMRDRIGDEAMHQRTGHLPEAFHVGPKLLWIRRNEPETFARTRLVLQPRDVVLHRLSGVVATDETHANATLLFNLRQRAWDPGLLADFGVDQALLPAALPPWAQAAELPERVASGLGLEAGVPLVIGAADSQCAAFGAGVIAPGPVSEMAGASSCLNSVVLSPLADLRVTHYSHVVPDCFSTELGVNTTGAAISWAVRALGYPGFGELAADAERFRRRLRRGTRGVSGTGSGGTGVTGAGRGTGVSGAGRTGRSGTPAVEAAPLFLPYLGDGERDDPTARAGFVGLSDRHDRAALAFAVIEGVALAVRSVLAVLEQAGSPLSELRTGGGGARIDLAGQLKADLLGRPVAHLDIDPAGFGAAMLAADAAGLSGEAGAAIAATSRRARRFTPSGSLSMFERERAAWFDQVRPSAAVHSPQELP
jgi:sugar (pentulose or hexulose) kinase